MASYELSQEAETNLLNIALYTIEQFGIEQARRYRDQLEKRFQELANHPKQYPSVDGLREGYRRSVCGAHSIYYREKTTCIEIVRIYGQQKLENL